MDVCHAVTPQELSNSSTSPLAESTQPAASLSKKRMHDNFTMDEVDILQNVFPGSPAFLTDSARQELAQEPSKMQRQEDTIYCDRQKKLKKRKM